MLGVASDLERTRATIRIHDKESPKRRDCSLARVGEVCTKLFYQTMNFFSLMRSGPNIAKMQQAVLQSDSELPMMDFPPLSGIPTFYFANDPSLTHLIFKSHRDGPYFTIDNASPDSIFRLIYDMLHDSTITSEDLVFTCSQEKSKQVRTVLNSILSPNSVQEVLPIIEATVQNTIDQWDQLDAFDLGKASHQFTCTVLSKTLLGIEDSKGELALSMHVFFDYISSRFLKKPTDPTEVHHAKMTFFRMVDQALTEKTGIAAKLDLYPELSLKDKRMLLFSLFFAGTDSTASSLTYCLLKCAQNESLQWDVFSEVAEQKVSMIRKILAEGLRVFTPVIGVTRIAGRDLIIKLPNGEERHIPKGAILAPSQNLAARCPMFFSPHQPSTFNAYHHGEVNKLEALPWAPFGSGSHACPGASLYQLIAETLISKLLHQGALSTSFKREPTQTGHFINKLAEPVSVIYRIQDRYT